MVRGVCDLYEPLAEESGIDLKLNGHAGIVVSGRHQLLAQAVANVLDNAVKYGAAQSDAAGGARSEITVSVVPRARPPISSSPTGPGIPPQDRDRVFKRFVRLEASRSQPGSGLGLSLAAAVARLHGGELILLDNAPGLKAVFSLKRRRVTLPRTKADAVLPLYVHRDTAIHRLPAGVKIAASLAGGFLLSRPVTSRS